MTIVVLKCWCVALTRQFGGICMKDNIEHAINTIGSDVRLNHIVSLRATKAKILLKYKNIVIGEFDLRSYLLKDFTYRYQKVKGYDADMVYWMDRFREGLYGLLQ